MAIVRTIEVTWDTPFSELPDDVRKSLSAKEATAYRRGPQVFKALASRCKFKPLASLFKKIGKLDVFRLHLFGERELTYRAYFGFSFVGERDYVLVRLPVPGRLPAKAPQYLERLYQDVGGVLERREYHCGWEAPECIRSIAEQGSWIDKAGLAPAEDCFIVFSFGNGDCAGYTKNGEGFIYDHENGLLKSFDLESFCKRYFGDYFSRHN